MKATSFIYQTTHKLYSVLPFKKQICQFLRFLPINSAKFYKDYKFRGPFKVKIDSDKQFKIIHHHTTIENEIFWKGLDNGWEKVSISIWKELSKISDCILDIGANTGVYSLISKTMNPDSQVYAFEPSKRVFEKLQANNRLNAFDIHLSATAISNENGQAIFYDFDTDHQYSASLNKDMILDETSKKEINVQTQTLEAFYAENGIEKMDLVKIDVEKHEAEVIDGMITLIEKFQPTMLIEILDDAIGEHIEEKLKNLNYLYFNIDEEKSATQVRHLQKSSTYNYLICNESIAKHLKLI